MIRFFIRLPFVSEMVLSFFSLISGIYFFFVFCEIQL